MATRTLILQGIIPHYRVPIFECLGRAVDLAVAHSAETAPASTAYETVRLPDRGFGRFHYQSGVPELARRFDVVIAMFDPQWLSSVRYCLTRGEAPFVWWGHGYGRSPLANRLRTALARRADAILLYDDEARARFVRAGIPGERAFVAPNTIAIPEPLLVEDASERSSFVFVGRLQARKRVDLLLEAFARAVDRIPAHVGLDIVGEGAEGEALRSLAARLGLESRVRFHGRVTDESLLRPIFARALAYVSPGPVGLGVLHAFAYGVPVVTCPGPGHGPELSNVREGETGLLVPAAPLPLGQALERLARDPAFAQGLGAAAHAHYAERRTPRHMIQGFLDAIAKATR